MSNATEEFRFVMLNMEPYSFQCANNTPFTVGRTLYCPRPGSYYELFQIYVEAMGAKPKIIWDSGVNIGAYENGTWTGFVGMMANGTIDTIAGSFQQTELRNQFFDFSFSYYEVRLVYLVKEVQSSLYERILGIFSPFAPDVWLLYLAAIVALLITYFFVNVCVLNYIKISSEKSYGSKCDSVWEYFRYLIYSCGNDVKLNSYSSIILFISGGIFALIMMNLYGGVLLSQLLTDTTSDPFSTADGVLNLIDEGKYKLIFDQSYARFWYYQEIETSNETHYARLRNSLIKHPYAYAENSAQALDMVRSGGYILPVLTDDVSLYLAYNLCDIATVSPDGFPSKYATLMFQKNASILKRFNAAVFSTQTLTDRIWNNYYGDDAQQRRANNCKQLATLSPLSLESCSGIFALLFVGFSLAALSCVAEMIKQRWISIIA